MQCFDHGEPFVGLCGWCGKQVCQRCITRQEGRKKYCRNCAGKMVSFKPAERIEDRVKAHSEAKVAPTHEDEPHIEVDTSAPVKRKVVVGHRKPVDPRHFELDDDVDEEENAPEEKVIAEEKPEPPKRPAFDPFPNATRGVSAPGPSPRVNLFSSQEPLKPRGMPQSHAPAHSTQPAKPEHSGAAAKAMGFFAASAMETKKQNSQPTHQPPHQPAAHPAVSQPSRPPASKPTSPPVHSAAQNAMSFFAASAMETKKQSAPSHSPMSNHSPQPLHHTPPHQTSPPPTQPSHPPTAHPTPHHTPPAAHSPSARANTPPVHSAAQNAMSFFAASAMETKRQSAQSTNNPTTPSQPHTSPTLTQHADNKAASNQPPANQPTPGQHPSPTTPTGAAQKAFSFLAESAKETQKKEPSRD